MISRNWSSSAALIDHFKLSKPAKIEILTKLLTDMGVPYTFKPATMGGLNKRLPYCIRIYGEHAKALAVQTGFAASKQLPKDFA
jgi:hypothetical protein